MKKSGLYMISESSLSELVESCLQFVVSPDSDAVFVDENLRLSSVERVLLAMELENEIFSITGKRFSVFDNLDGDSIEKIFSSRGNLINFLFRLVNVH